MSPTPRTGRGMTLCAVSLPMEAAAALPASTEARTAATSPLTMMVTRVDPTFS